MIEQMNWETKAVFDFNNTKGPLPVHRHGLGQGGYTKEPVLKHLGKYFDRHEAAVIRLFVQEYYHMMPDADQYHWDDLDNAIASVRSLGAEPLLALCMKPKVLYPLIDQTVVHPNHYGRWQHFIIAIVKRYNKELHWNVRYWEISNEPDLGEGGGCPKLFTAEDYCIYYEKTVAAILEADPHVKVGGPALANCRSSILEKWLDYCVQRGIRVDFVSWHIYTVQPDEAGTTIRYVNNLLERYPQIHCETILNEWNMPVWGDIHPLIQQKLKGYPTLRCAHMLACIHEFINQGLHRSNYYHIKEQQFQWDQFAPWFSKEGMKKQAAVFDQEYDWALFDLQDNPRPHYYAFKMLQGLSGEWLQQEDNPDNSKIRILGVKKEEKCLFLVINYSFDSPQNFRLQLRIRGKTSELVEISALDKNSIQNDAIPVKLLDCAEYKVGTFENAIEIIFELEPYGVYLIKA